MEEMDVDVKPESRLVPSSFSSERLSLVEDIDKDDQVLIRLIIIEPDTVWYGFLLARRHKKLHLRKTVKMYCVTKVVNKFFLLV